MKTTHVLNVLPRMTLLASLSLLGWSGAAVAGPTVTTNGGTVNYVPKFNGTATVTNSQIVDNGTSVGIGTGTAAPGAKLEVKGSSSGILVNAGGPTGNPFVKLIGDNSGEGANLWYNNATGDISLDQIWPQDSTKMHFRMKTAGTAVEPLTLTATGNVGIGTTAPMYKLEVNGQIWGARYQSPTVARQTASIKPLDNPVGRIECLEGVSYRAKSARADEDFQLGLVGEDVEACFPELVSTTPDGEKSIDYSRLVVPLIEASKDQQQTIEALEARLARLEASLKTTR